MRRLTALLMLVLGLVLAGRPAWAETGPQRSERIEAELVAMTAWATPGSTLMVAVRQDIRPDWHTYWRNPGDSGGATTLVWSLPAGLSAGDIVWPLPERQRIATLVNYGYSGVVYLPVPITIPANAPTDQTLRLRVEARFLVCSDEMCVPDDLNLALDIPVRDGAPPLVPEHGAAIQAAMAATPQPAGIEARATLDGGVLTLTAAGGPAGGGEASRAWFLPFQGGVIDHAAPQTGERGPEGLTLRLKPGGVLAAGGLNAPLPGVLVIDGKGYEIVASPGEPLAGASGGGGLTDAEAGSSERGGWGLFLQAALFAFLGGIILNLMPCVFPILAMKAAALASVGGDRAEARRDGLGFLAGVLATFLVLAAALLLLRAGGQAVGWGFQLQSPGVTAGLALLMLAVALNLSGVFNVGAGLQGAASGPLSRLPGWAGAFFTGVLAVAVAAPCTAPFMAFALGAALVLPWPLALTVFLMLGLGFALPFVAASLTPGLIRRLPRPGPWMDRLKAVLAFPMYGAALWLAWVFGQQAGAMSSALLLAGGLALAFALWLGGTAQVDRASGRRAIVATICAGAAAVLALGLTVLAARSAVAPAAGEAAAGRLASQPWSAATVQTAQAEGRPVFVNFTADWCVTCKVNERTSLSSAAVAEAFEAANALYLVGDWTLRDDSIAAELERHGRSGVPLYLVYPAGGGAPVVLPQLLTEGVVTAALETAAAP
ncbi:protein-disulfide reductase DsbD family protein [Brevundimonas sp. VNH65]|uniref:protein-disulfide reductase DsbD family protein n=1 Tax=Brevundimonas sp. VNH65 TaxID=3400917 RepID=UPI003C095B44